MGWMLAFFALLEHVGELPRRVLERPLARVRGATGMTRWALFLTLWVPGSALYVVSGLASEDVLLASRLTGGISAAAHVIIGVGLPLWIARMGGLRDDGQVRGQVRSRADAGFLSFIRGTITLTLGFMVAGLPATSMDAELALVFIASTLHLAALSVPGYSTKAREMAWAGSA